MKESGRHGLSGQCAQSHVELEFGMRLDAEVMMIRFLPDAQNKNKKQKNVSSKNVKVNSTGTLSEDLDVD